MGDNDTGGSHEQIDHLGVCGGPHRHDLDHGGGTGDLFKFDTGADFVPEPATILLIGTAVPVLLRRRRNT